MPESTSELVEAVVRVADRISRGWIQRDQYNESFTVGAFDRILSGLRGPEAYALLVELCHKVSAMRNDGVGMETYFDLLSVVARLTNTTEMPSQMTELVKEHPELVRAISSWYRVEPS